MDIVSTICVCSVLFGTVHATGHRILGQESEPIILHFTCNMTNVTSIKIEMMLLTKIHYLVVKYDVIREICTEIGSLHSDRIEACVLNGSIFSFTIRKLSFLDKGMYLAWGDMGYLMDSVFVDIEENNTISSLKSTHRYFTSSFIPNLSSPEAENYLLEWILVSAVVVVLVAAGLIINALGMLQQRIISVSKTTSNNLTHRNGRPNKGNSSRNCFQDIVIAHTHERNVMILKEDNSLYALTDFKSAQSHVNVTLNGKHPWTRRMDCANSTVSKDEIHPILPSSCEKIHSEHFNENDHVHGYDKVVNERRSDHLYLPSKLGTNPTVNLAQESYNYETVIQHSYMTLRPSTTDTIVNMKTMEDFTIADSFSRHNIVNKKSPSRVDSSTLFANVNQTRHNEIHCTDNSAGIGNRNMECQSVSQTLNYDFTGQGLEISSARKRRHRRSKSCGALYDSPMGDTSVRQLRSSCVSTIVFDDGYNSL